jgi:hypothetical protein
MSIEDIVAMVDADEAEAIADKQAAQPLTVRLC